MLTLGDKVHLAVIWTLELLAFLANLLFITAVVLKTPKKLRAYSVFLLNNAIIDLTSAAVAALGTVRVVLDHEGSMIYVFIGPCTLINEQICRMVHALHTGLVQQSTFLLLLSFAYRLYVISSIMPARRQFSLLEIELACLVTFAPMLMHSVAFYLAQTDVRAEIRSRFDLDDYTTASSPLWGSARTIVTNAIMVVLSPVVMTAIFFIRRKLMTRISQAKSMDNHQHLTIARALTYQLLLPCGTAVGAAFWMMDLTEIWSSNFSERFIMITCSLFSLASPLINLLVLPPYRAFLPFARTTKPIPGVGVQALRDFTSVSS